MTAAPSLFYGCINKHQPSSSHSPICTHISISEYTIFLGARTAILFFFASGSVAFYDIFGVRFLVVLSRHPIKRLWIQCVLPQVVVFGLCIMNFRSRYTQPRSCVYVQPQPLVTACYLVPAEKHISRLMALFFALQGV